MIKSQRLKISIIKFNEGRGYFQVDINRLSRIVVKNISHDREDDTYDRALNQSTEGGEEIADVAIVDADAELDFHDNCTGDSALSGSIESQKSDDVNAKEVISASMWTALACT